MRVPSNLRSGEVGFNMTPMIDVVFLLIIFCLVSSHLAKQETQMELPLPDAVTGERRTDEETPRLTVNVAGNGQLLVAGRPVPATDLRNRLEEKRRESGPDVEVVIRSDRAVTYGQVEPIMLDCVRAGIWNVTFAVYRPEDAR